MDHRPWTIDWLLTENQLFVFLVQPIRSDMHNFRKLRVYELSLDVAEAVYRYSSRFDASERYNLTDQLRRCAVSVPSNIAEGCGRTSDKDAARFVSNALGSAYETETQLVLASRLGYRRDDSLLERVIALQKQLRAFYDHLTR